MHRLNPGPGPATVRVVEAFPFIEQAVIEALEKRRCSAALLHGQPIEVDYIFRITLALPE